MLSGSNWDPGSCAASSYVVANPEFAMDACAKSLDNSKLVALKVGEVDEEYGRPSAAQDASVPTLRATHVAELC